MRNERGITLIALVISIIIMLILASITVAVLLGDNGIFTNSGTAKIMSKVETLDDSIKAYTIKNKDPYSSSTKTIDDLINEGILKKITLTGDNPESEKDNKTLYYVNFENKDVEVAELLGLEKKAYENSEKLTTFEYTKLEDLQNKGIYVVDNDLNAAYLKNSRTYGKLVNYGIYEEDQYVAEFEQQKLTLKINKRVQEPQQEVIFILDRSPSMAAPQDVNANPARVYDKNGKIYRGKDPNGIDWEVTWNKTRWAGILNAADMFCDTYFKDSTGNRALTIYTYYGTSKDDQVAIDGIENLGTFITASDAKNSYANICSKKQFLFAMKKLTQEYYIRYTSDEFEKKFGNNDESKHNEARDQTHKTYTIINNWGDGDYAVYYLPSEYEQNHTGMDKENGYRIDCGVFQYNFMQSNFWSGEFKDKWTNETYTRCEKATFGPGTCTPNALLKVEAKYLKSNPRPKDIIMLTDGDSGSFWGECVIIPKVKKYADNDKSIATIAARIMNEEIGGHKTGIYPIAYGPAVSRFKDSFSGHFSEFYTAGDEETLAENFQNILDNIIEKVDAQTNTATSHTLQYMDNRKYERLPNRRGI